MRERVALLCRLARTFLYRSLIICFSLAVGWHSWVDVGDFCQVPLSISENPFLPPKEPSDGATPWTLNGLVENYGPPLW